MIFFTHIAFSLLLMELLGLGIGGLPLLLIGALLPDADSEHSLLGRFLLLWLVLRHRGILHNAFLPFLFYPYSKHLAVGYFSHILLDTFTVQGVRPFQPISDFRASGPLESASFFFNLALTALFLGFMLLLPRPA